MSVLIRAVLLGLATGGRSTAGLAALALTNPSSAGALGNRWTRWLAGTAAAGELVEDKLPQTPSRLRPEGLVPRLALGAASGAILTHREGGSRNRTALAGALGLLGAAAGSRLGASWRQLAGRRFGSSPSHSADSDAAGQDVRRRYPDLPGALIEDASCAAAVYYASRARR
ncbi:MAG TPA: hypothetical protein VGX49_12775 [Jatrophihabitans sp.]|jgi:uncharacterized membrane protein|nr:hypothetical protein [Jatrophihabitans sp.]